MSFNSLFKSMNINLVTPRARLEPLDLAHAEALLEAGSHPDIWRYLPCPMPQSIAESEAWIKQALEDYAQRKSVPFVIVRKEGSRIAGTTRYMDIKPEDRGLEIGWTWLSRVDQGTGLNCECKFALLQYAFETLGVVRVQLKTDSRNKKSQRAMEKLGFTREGVLRKSRLCWDSHYRDTVYYSVLDTEWPELKERLLSGVR